MVILTMAVRKFLSFLGKTIDSRAGKAPFKVARQAGALNRSAAIGTLVLALPFPAMGAFVGSFSADFRYDENIFDGVQLGSSPGSVVISQGVSPSDLVVEMHWATRIVTVPLLSSGNAALLSRRNHDLGDAIAMDVALLSDGNNMVLAYVEAAKTNLSPNPISFAVAQWQRNPATVGTADLLGQWQTTVTADDTNLRDVTNGLSLIPSDFRSPIVFSLQDDPLSMTIPPTFTLPLAVSGNRLIVPGTPTALNGAVRHAFEFMFGAGRNGSFFSVATELDDLADVSLTIGLVSGVPEPEVTYLLGVGIAIVVAFRRRVGRTSTQSARQCDPPPLQGGTASSGDPRPARASRVSDPSPSYS
ncbi:MAG: hypothetical protein U1F52_07810 [Burkholderiales bacterium]